jgi:hypothetical protein
MMLRYHVLTFRRSCIAASPFRVVCQDPELRWSRLHLAKRACANSIRTSAEGQKETFEPFLSVLFDHLIRTRQDGGRHFEAERLRGLEVEYKFVPRRRLHRQIGRLLALKDAVDVAGGPPVLIDVIRPIGDQAASGDEGAFEVDRGQLVPGRGVRIRSR